MVKSKARRSFWGHSTLHPKVVMDEEQRARVFAKSGQGCWLFLFWLEPSQVGFEYSSFSTLDTLSYTSILPWSFSSTKKTFHPPFKCRGLRFDPHRLQKSLPSTPIISPSASTSLAPRLLLPSELGSLPWAGVGAAKLLEGNRWKMELCLLLQECWLYQACKYNFYIRSWSLTGFICQWGISGLPNLYKSPLNW